MLAAAARLRFVCRLAAETYVGWTVAMGAAFTAYEAWLKTMELLWH